MTSLRTTLAVAALSGAIGLGAVGLTAGSAVAAAPQPMASAAVSSTPVNDQTMKRFEGWISTSGGTTAVSRLGVIAQRNSRGQDRILQAKEIRGDRLYAKITYSEIPGDVVGSFKTIVPFVPGFHPGPLARGFSKLLGSWDGHGRHLSVAANGQLKFSSRDYRSADPSKQLTAEGFLRTQSNGSQRVTIYLSHVSGLKVGDSYPVSLRNGVVTVAGTTFCGAGAGAGTCGA